MRELPIAVSDMKDRIGRGGWDRVGHVALLRSCYGVIVTLMGRVTRKLDQPNLVVPVLWLSLSLKKDSLYHDLGGAATPRY